MESKMNHDNGNDRAVSPVIGVILMVAITVILAAVIAAFVLDLGNQSQPAQASFNVDENSDGDLTILVQDATRIDTLQLRGASCFDGGSSSSYDVSGLTLEVGNEVTLDHDESEIGHCQDEEVNLVAIYDGSDSIVQSFDYEGSSATP